MPLITCTGRDGVVRQFDVTEEKDQFAQEWHYRVVSIPPPSSGEHFDMTLTEVDPTTVQIAAINANNDPAYSGMGIPEPLIAFAARSLGRTVISSPTAGAAGVWRTDAATTMWDRIMANGHATYDPVRDIYTFLP